MTKVLLIDDDAENGWQEIIEKVLFQEDPIEIALDVSTATNLLTNKKFDIIFLDLRFSQEDQIEKSLKKFGGYKLLKDVIRKSLDSTNFATPVIIFTASNKIWNIFEMLEQGADSYYIKEHPDTSFDLEFSRTNFIRLKNFVLNSFLLGEERQNILEKILSLNTLTDKNIHNLNIRKRVQEKLKIGYALLFQKNSSFEKNNFLFSNDSMAFLAFWSILEEIAKDSFVDNWILDGDNEGTMKEGNWTLRNDISFVENISLDDTRQNKHLRIGIKYKSGQFQAGSIDLSPLSSEFNLYSNQISLKLQIYAVMLLYKKWNPYTSKKNFDELNKFRNRIDFTHSSVSKIFKKSLSDYDINSKARNNCDKMLTFLTALLS